LAQGSKKRGGPGGAVDGAQQGRGARSMARLRCAVALARPLRRAPPSTARKGLHEKCPAAALRASSNRAGVRPSSRALHLSTFRVNAAPSGFCISLLALQTTLASAVTRYAPRCRKVYCLQDPPAFIAGAR